MSARPRKKHTFLLVILALAVICAAILLDSAYGLVSDEFTVTGAPEPLDGFRIVQLSDLHLSRFGKDDSRLLRRVAEAEPDIIALTGDFLNSSDSSEGDGTAATLGPLMRSLASIAPTYFVSGNHDWASHELDSLWAVMEENGVTPLENSWLQLENGLILVGVTDPNGWADMPKPDEVVLSARAELGSGFLLLLAHRNDWPLKYPELDADLILCGHGHGGIMRLPFLGGLLGTGGELLPEYDAGLFDCGAYDMLVSRGLGNSISLPRFLNTPQISVITLAS